MTNKNVEIIEDELKKIHGEYVFAKAQAIINGKYNGGEDEWKNKFFKPHAIILLSKLNIPEEGEVIAEGELFLSQDSGITMIKNTKFINIDEKLYKYQGKKGRLVFIEDKIINDNKGKEE